MAFDYGRLQQAAMKIEDYLGILKGNELVKQYFEDYAASLPQSGEEWPEGFSRGPQGFGFHTAEADGAPEWDLCVQFMPHLGGAPVLGDGQGPEQDQLNRQIHEGAKTSYENGLGWASGLSGYLTSIVQSFCLPDVEDFKGVSESLVSDISWIEMGKTDFAKNTSKGVDFGSRLDSWMIDGWDSDAAIAFNSFYDNVANQILMYGNVASGAAALVSGAGAVIQAAQSGVIEYFEKVGDILREQCLQWAETNGNPQSYQKPDLKLLTDLIGIGKDVVDAIPVIDKLAGAPSAVVEVTEKIGSLIKAGELINKYVDIPENRKRPTSFTLESADTLYTEITSHLYDDLLGGFDEAMTALETGRSTGLRTQVDGLKSGDQGDWFPPKVPGITKEGAW